MEKPAKDPLRFQRSGNILAKEETRKESMVLDRFLQETKYSFINFYYIFKYGYILLDRWIRISRSRRRYEENCRRLDSVWEKMPLIGEKDRQKILKDLKSMERAQLEYKSEINLWQETTEKNLEKYKTFVKLLFKKR